MPKSQNVCWVELETFEVEIIGFYERLNCGNYDYLNVLYQNAPIKIRVPKKRFEDCRTLRGAATLQVSVYYRVIDGCISHYELFKII